MRFDETHRPWKRAALAIGGLAAVAYIVYTAHAGPPRGGSVPGLIFGIAGYLLMMYAALLGLRKRRPRWRVGRASTWMRGHLWLGFLSFPLLLFHSGFAAKGPLTAWLMTVLIVVVVTGMLGALVQHYLPKMMTKLVPLETIYEEIPRIRKQLQKEAEELMSGVTGAAGGRADTTFVWGARPRRSEQTQVVELEPQALERLEEVFRETVHPFLKEPDRVKNACSIPEQSAGLFASLRLCVPESAQHVVADLESICEEERQLKRQKLLYRCLHGWLLVHVPLSLALILLGGIHAVVALRY